MTYREIRENQEIRAYYEKGNANLGVLGYTDHSVAHAAVVAEGAAKVLGYFDYPEHDKELARIAGFMHDINMKIPNMKIHKENRVWQIILQPIRRYILHRYNRKKKICI